jgi:hypothetical protein
MQTVFAVPITFLFASTIDRVDVPMEDPVLGAITIGSPVLGSFTFDSDAEDLNPAEWNGEYEMFGPPFGIRGEIGRVPFSATNIRINLIDDYPFLPFALDDMLVSSSLSPGPLGTDLRIRIQMIEGSGRPLSSDNLPLVPPMFSADASRYFTVQGSASTGESFALGGFDLTLEPVPEPSTTAMMIGSMIAAASLLRGRSKSAATSSELRADQITTSESERTAGDVPA